LPGSNLTKIRKLVGRHKAAWVEVGLANLATAAIAVAVLLLVMAAYDKALSAAKSTSGERRVADAFDCVWRER
jgi:hypothetical protein